jgi:hypothetical protein
VTNPALILGGAKCFDSDLARLEAMIGRPWPGLVFGVNDQGYTWPRRLDHWCTLHAEKFKHTKYRWCQKREEMLARLGRPLSWNRPEIWSCTYREVVDHHFAERWRNGTSGGSSGLYAVACALHVGCDRIVLCGVPMDEQPNRYREEERWHGRNRYMRAWSKKALPEIRGVVKSMSGWTKELLGAPTLGWLAGCVDTAAPTGVAS